MLCRYHPTIAPLSTSIIHFPDFFMCRYHPTIAPTLYFTFRTFFMCRYHHDQRHLPTTQSTLRFNWTERICLCLIRANSTKRLWIPTACRVRFLITRFNSLHLNSRRRSNRKCVWVRLRTTFSQFSRVFVRSRLDDRESIGKNDIWDCGAVRIFFLSHNLHVLSHELYLDTHRRTDIRVVLLQNKRICSELRGANSLTRGHRDCRRSSAKTSWSTTHSEWRGRYLASI